MLFFFQAQGVDYRAAFEQGLEAYEHGDYAGAAQRWERLLESIGQERGYKVCYNLGLAYQKLGDPTRAIERLETFAERAAKEPTRDDDAEQRRQDALERVKALKSQHGALRVAAAPPG